MKKSLQFLAILILSATAQATLAADRNVQQTAPAASSGATTSETTTTTTAKKPIGAANLIQQLQKAGYVIKTVEYDKDNNKYKVDAVDRFGEKQSLDLDASVGLTPDQRKIPHETSMQQAVKKVEKSGTYIKSAQSNADSYTVTAVDNQGNEQNYTIDRKTGKVTQ